MGVDYWIFQKTSLYRPLYREPYSFVEGYHFNNLKYLCEVMDLPPVPYYYASERHPYEPHHEAFRWQHYELPCYDDHFILVPSSNQWTGKGKERYQAYLDWMDWGLEKMQQLTLEDIQQCSKIDDERNRECLLNSLEELKEDIVDFLRWYKEHRYVFTSV